MKAVGFTGTARGRAGLCGARTLRRSAPVLTSPARASLIDFATKLRELAPNLPIILATSFDAGSGSATAGSFRRFRSGPSSADVLRTWPAPCHAA